MNLSFNHVGITVGDVDKAADWYGKVLGFTRVSGPFEIAPGDDHFGKLSIDILGSRLRRGRLLHMVDARGVGIELFEFQDPENGRSDMRYWENGPFHIGLTTESIEATIEAIVEGGGKQNTDIWETHPGSGRRLVYCEDPWGNPIELYEHTYGEQWGEQQSGGTRTGLVVEVRVKEHFLDDFKSATCEVMERVRNEPGCEQMHFTQLNSDPLCFVIFERWNSREYLLSDDHQKSPHLAAYFKLIGPMIDGEVRYETLDIVAHHVA